MKSFFRFFAERSLLAYIITLLIVLLGISSLVTIKRDSFPSVEFGEVLITTQYPGASPEDVELKVTNEVEKEIKEVTGIKRYQSSSMENVSIVHIVIDPDDKDPNKIIRELREAVSRVTDLPEEVTESPLVTELSTSVFPMIEIGLMGDIPYPELREAARRFEKKLENLPGVSKVERFGYHAREITVEVKPEKLKKYDISLNQVIGAIRKRNVRGSGGSFESYVSEKNIVTLAQFRDPLEVKNVIVKTSYEGPLIKIEDLAIVRDGFEEEKILSRVNGQAAISFVTYKTESADIIRTVDNIMAFIEKEKTRLPEGVKILISDDHSTNVRSRFQIVSTNGLIGLVLVLLVLTLFLNFRVAFWVAVGVPVTILGVIFLLPMFNTFLDSITMTAMVLVIGIIVDDAIIISENIYQHAEQGLSPIDAAVEGITGVYKPVMTTILTTLVVFAPLFFMPGMLGKFIYVIPLVITLALFVSLAESTLALPAHLAAGLHKHKLSNSKDKRRMFDYLRDAYLNRLNTILKFRYALTLAFIAVLSGAVYYAANFMDFVLFPSSTADRFMVKIETPNGTSLKATSDRSKQIENLVTQLDKSELDSYLTRVGTFGDIGSSVRENNAALMVVLTPYATRDRTADQIIAELRSKTDKLEGFNKISFIIDSGGPPVGRPIMLRIVGSDDTLRKRMANDIYAFLNTIEGAKDIERDDKPGKHQVEIKLNYETLARVGISVADVAQNVRMAYDGEVVTNVRYGDEDVDFRVIFHKAVRKNPAHLKKLLIPNASGHLTPLRLVAHFDSAPGPANIHHFKGERAIMISGDIDKTITTPIKVSQTVLSHFDIDKDYPGMRLVIGGEAEESKKSLDELFIIMGVAILGVYFLLVLLFNSIWQPFMVMIAIPFGFIGVVVGFSLHNEALGFLAMTGIIGLAGVVVNDSLVLVNHINDIKRMHPDKGIIEIVSQGTSDRLRAVVLTTISTVAGLLPLAYGIGGSDPYMSPMALALGWGLLFATPLTLLLIPCLYLIIDDIGKIWHKILTHFKKNEL